jgi:hypothetical protein
VIEQLARLPDKGFPKAILVRTRPFAHQHPACAAVTHAGHRLPALFAQSAGATGSDFVLQPRPVKAGDARTSERIWRSLLR